MHQQDTFPGVPGDDDFNRNMYELGLRVADAIEVENPDAYDAIMWRGQQALLEAQFRL